MVSDDVWYPISSPRLLGDDFSRYVVSYMFSIVLRLMSSGIRVLSVKAFLNSVQQERDCVVNRWCMSVNIYGSTCLSEL